jgi:hypothetical protein
MPQLTGVPAFDKERVVDAELFAASYRLHGLYEDPAIAVFRFAVGAARMIDPPGAVAVHRTVYDGAVADVEIEGMVRMRRIAGVTEQRLLPGDTLAPVFTHLFARGKCARGEYTPAVNR